MLKEWIMTKNTRKYPRIANKKNKNLKLLSIKNSNFFPLFPLLSHPWLAALTSWWRQQIHHDDVAAQWRHSCTVILADIASIVADMTWTTSATLNTLTMLMSSTLKGFVSCHEKRSSIMCRDLMGWFVDTWLLYVNNPSLTSTLPIKTFHFHINIGIHFMSETPHIEGISTF